MCRGTTPSTCDCQTRRRTARGQITRLTKKPKSDERPHQPPNRESSAQMVRGERSTTSAGRRRGRPCRRTAPFQRKPSRHAICDPAIVPTIKKLRKLVDSRRKARLYLYLE